MSGVFSQWKCVGDMESVEGLDRRTCVFSDVCYDVARREFAFFRQEGLPPEPVLYDHRRGRVFHFRQRRSEGHPVDSDFVRLNRWLPWGGDVVSWEPDAEHRAPRARPHLRVYTWAPHIRLGPRPENHTLLPGLHALSAPLYATNIGHVLWNEVFPLFGSMLRLGVHAECLQVIRTHGCEVFTEEGKRELCARFERGMFAPLQGPCGKALLTLPQLVAANPGHRHICFEQVLAGASYDLLETEELNVGLEPIFRALRARVLAWYGIDPAQAPRSHQILMVKKEGRRSIHNFDAVAAHVQARFGNVSRVCSETFLGLTWAQQFRIIADTTVAVSPCGGISMLLPFLPSGAFAILINYMRPFPVLLGTFLQPVEHGECAYCSWTMEAALWRHVAHVRKSFYQVWGRRDFAEGRPGRDGAVVVNPARLARLVETALAAMAL